MLLQRQDLMLFLGFGTFDVLDYHLQWIETDFGSGRPDTDESYAVHKAAVMQYALQYKD